MPPKAAAAGSSRRGDSQVNPTRPVKAFFPPSATRGSTVTSGRMSVKNPSTNATRTALRPSTAVLSSDESEQEEAARDSDEAMEDEQHVPSPPDADAMISLTPPIPPALLARLLYENLSDSNTRIQKGALALVSKYMEIFVREAFARAKNEREIAIKEGGISDGFLQVEDLEKLAPQLILDF